MQKRRRKSICPRSNSIHLVIQSFDSIVLQQGIQLSSKSYFIFILLKRKVMTVTLNHSMFCGSEVAIRFPALTPTKWMKKTSNSIWGWSKIYLSIDFHHFQNHSKHKLTCTVNVQWLNLEFKSVWYVQSLAHPFPRSRINYFKAFGYNATLHFLFALS